MESEVENWPDVAELWSLVQEQRVQIERLQAQVCQQREKRSAYSRALSQGSARRDGSAHGVTRARWLKTAIAGVAGILGALTADKRTALAESEPFAVETCRQVNTTGFGGGGVGFNAPPAANFAFGARCYGTDVGVMGFSRSATGRGVLGLSYHGYGGFFQGFTAAVHLVPSGAPTHPATGLRGDLFVDATGRLWFCKGGALWKQLA